MKLDNNNILLPIVGLIGLTTVIFINYEVKILYFIMLMIYIYISYKANKKLEIILAFTFFGFEFTALLSDFLDIKNILILLIISLSLAIINYRTFVSFFQKNVKFLIIQVAFVLLIIYSFLFSEFDEYAIFKLQLLIVWWVMLNVSLVVGLKIYRENNYEIDFTFLIILSALFFSCFFIELGNTVIELWNKYYRRYLGLRGVLDVITISRYAGMGIILIFISFFKAEETTIKEKIILNLTRLVSLGIFIPILILTQTRQAVLCLAITLVVLFVKNFKFNFRYLIFTAIIIFSLYQAGLYYTNLVGSSRLIEENTSTGRDQMFDKSMIMFSGINIFTGIGWGDYSVKSGGNINRWPHNIFVEVALEMGVFMFISLSITLFFLGLYNYINSKSRLEMVFLMGFIYYLLLAQISADLPRNFYVFIFGVIGVFFRMSYKGNRI